MAATAANSKSQFLAQHVKGYETLLNGVKVNTPEWEVLRFLLKCVRPYDDGSFYLAIRYCEAEYLVRESLKGVSDLPRLFWDTFPELDRPFEASSEALNYWCQVEDFNLELACEALRIGMNERTDAWRWFDDHAAHHIQGHLYHTLNIPEITPEKIKNEYGSYDLYRFPDGSGLGTTSHDDGTLHVFVVEPSLAQQWVKAGVDTMPDYAERVEVTDMTSTWRFPDGSGVVLTDGDSPWVFPITA